MKNKSVIFSRSAATFLLGSLLFAGFAVYFFSIWQKVWGWVSVGCAAFFLLSVVFIPLCYVVDGNGIRIRYITGDKEKYEWKNVRKVVAEYDLTLPFFFDTYLIDGDDYTVYMFYKEGRMERSAALASAIEKYSGKPVDGLIPEGVKGAAARRFKLSYGKTPDSGEAQAAERQARKTVRAAIGELGEGAKALKLGYAYCTADGESDKRPAVDYTYVLKVEGKEPVTLLSVKRKARAMRVERVATADEVKGAIEKYL